MSMSSPSTVLGADLLQQLCTALLAGNELHGTMRVLGILGFLAVGSCRAAGNQLRWHVSIAHGAENRG